MMFALTLDQIQSTLIKYTALRHAVIEHKGLGNHIGLAADYVTILLCRIGSMGRSW